MILEFKTKTDINGNTISLIIDVDNKTYKYGYFLTCHEPIITTKQYLRKLLNNIKQNNYKEV